MTWPDTLRYGRLPHLQGLQSFSRFKTEDIKQTKSMSLIWFFAATVSAREKQILRQRPLYQLAFLQPSGEEFLCKASQSMPQRRGFSEFSSNFQGLYQVSYFTRRVSRLIPPHISEFFGKRLQSCFIATAGHDEVRPTSRFKKHPKRNSEDETYKYFDFWDKSILGPTHPKQRLSWAALLKWPQLTFTKELIALASINPAMSFKCIQACNWQLHKDFRVAVLKWNSRGTHFDLGLHPLV